MDTVNDSARSVETLTTSQFGCPAGDGMLGYLESVAVNVGVLTDGSQEVLGDVSGSGRKQATARRTVMVAALRKDTWSRRALAKWACVEKSDTGNPAH